MLPFIKKNNPLTSRNICTLENNFVVINQSECATTRILDINKTILSPANLVNIFPKGFDQSIFNQIFNDMKKSTDVTIYKEPEISFCQSSLHSQDIITQDKHVMNQLNGLWRDTYQIQLNPNMVNKYKSDESILRDDNITDEDRKLWERNMNSYRNGPL